MWTFQIAAGKILSRTGLTVGTAYAGHGAARDNPADEGEHGQADGDRITAGGPIPEGSYKMVELRLDGRHLGPYAIRLEPDPETASRIFDLGRDPASFFIHGDNVGNDASEGCIVTNRSVRQMLWESEDHDLTVTA